MAAAGYIWKFIANPRASEPTHIWLWVKCAQGRALYQSMDSFPTFVACVDNARLRGFTISDQFEVMEDRRREPRVAA